MTALRRIVIGLTALGAVLLLFAAYNYWSDTPPMEHAATDSGQAMAPPERGATRPEMGQVRLGPTEMAKFTVRDPFTRKLRRLFGFYRLLNPHEDTMRWRLDRPYMNIYEDHFFCRITSDKGTVLVEKVEGNYSPRDAELSENVRIYLKSLNPEDPVECMICMDDLNYSSERSLFSTAGPVRLVSAEAELVGTGMELIYNAGKARIELLRIADLDHMRIRGLAQQQTRQTKDRPTKQQVEQPSPGKPDTKSSEATEAESKPGTIPPTETAAIETPDYYFCRLTKNVVIWYGRQLKLSGGDQVDVTNILWSSRATKTASEPSSPMPETSGSKETAEATSGQFQVPASESVVVSGIPEDAGDAFTAPQVQDNDEIDVVIQCDGEVLVRPMEFFDEALASKNRQTVQMAGMPLHIEQAGQVQTRQMNTLARCGALQYEVDTQNLRMGRGNWQEDTMLNFGQEKGQLFTPGLIHYDRLGGWADIAGPGRLVLQDTGETTDADNRSTELFFEGKMHLLFAEVFPEKTAQKLILQSANLIGGIRGRMISDGESTLAADSARFQFDQTNVPRQADFEGNVQMASSQGSLFATKARLLFAADKQGQTRVNAIQTDGVVTFVSSSSGTATATDKAARFVGKNALYDVTTGNAAAQGPIEFTFYVDPPDPNRPGAEPVPVVITATRQAEYNAAANQITFFGNVVGVHEMNMPEYTQKSVFEGDRLIVHLLGDQALQSQMRLKQVSLLGNNVKVDSIRTDAGQTISHVRLLGERMDYFADGEILQVLGPGKIELNNANVTPLAAQDRRQGVDLRGPCYGIMQGFRTLRWYQSADRIIADGGGDTVQVSYQPVENGQLGKRIWAAAPYVEAAYAQTPQGRNELSFLDARGDVFYYEEDGNIFVGTESLHYDTATSIMTLTCRPGDPCLVNGATVSGIEYDLATGRIQTEMEGGIGIIPFASEPTP
ncbi:MAG: hypothetical protein JW828_05870 [Sedimentisphaerales bacterium]|nr:hypothetical protein [Sedimentisphaerales bacterium]